MNYEIGEQVDGGYAYRIEIPGGHLVAWRRGTRQEVEEHARKCAKAYAIRAKGEVIKRYRTGERRATRNGRTVTEKEQIE